jgi:subtilisin family serine protease
MNQIHPRHDGRSRRWRTVLTAACVAFGVFGAGVSAAAPGTIRTPQPIITGGETTAALSVEVQPTLLRRLSSGGKGDFAIELREQADLSGAFAMPWQQRGRYVHERLRETAERSQARLRRDLTARGVAFEPHWIKNVILVHGGDVAALRSASAFAEVKRIRELPQAGIVKPELPALGKQAKAATAGVGENIGWIGADQVWTQGTKGNGITVGVIDTGALYTHAALRQQYRGWHNGSFDHDYNWYYPGVRAPVPESNDSHGSHVLGTIVGDDHAADSAQRNRIGVAPGAQWIACMGFPVDGNSSFNLLSCGEFMLAPTRTDGSQADPDKRPQVVNNSWSEGNCDGNTSSFYADVVDAWVAAGIFPVFAAGNAFSCGLPEPAGLSTVSSPASLASSFAVGSSGNHDGLYATHSLLGPTTAISPGLPNYPDPRGFPQLKPQVVAPGVDIRSVSDTGDQAYTTMTGTSMSAPHIAGLVALMLDAGECLAGDYARLGTIIMQTARPIDYASGGTPAPGPGNVPNYATGWGEIDAPAAVNAAAAACGPQGFLAGRVTTANGTPIAGAKIEVFVDANVRVYELTTESDGSYIRRLPEQLSGYTVRVSAYGYLASNESGVIVNTGATTPYDVRLNTASQYKVSGSVKDAATGWPLHARVTIAGYPGEPIWTDATTGAYSIRLAEGTAYRFDVMTDIAGYQVQGRDVASIASATEQSFSLSADLIACVAPGYAFNQNVFAENFESNVGAPPSGWNASSAGIGWLFGTNAELSTPWFPIPAHGRFAVSNDALGADEGWSNNGSVDYLEMPAINLIGRINPVLRYRSYFRSNDQSLGGARVQASTDGGTTWVALGVPTRSQTEWTDEAVSLASVATANLRIRFHYDDGTQPDNDISNPGWAIDDVSIDAGCTAPAQGGLVIGHVRDANTGAGLDGAAVNIGSSATTHTFANTDPGIGAGFFALYAAPGTATIDAQRGKQPVGYGDASATVAVSNGATVLRDLALPAGRLRLYPPAGPAASVVLGTTASVPFTVRNTGTLPLHFGFEGVAIEEHFEDAVFPPAGWTVENKGADCPWSVPYLGNSAGGDGHAAGVNLFPCWGKGDIDTSLVMPSIDLSSSGTASLGFFLSLLDGADSNPRLDVDVSRDGGASWTTIFTQAEGTDARDPLNLVELDLSAFAGAADVRVRFHYRATPPWGYVLIDQVHLFGSVNASPLLDVTPSAGTLAPNASIETNATFDARAVAQPGVYTVPIRIAEDTPYEWPFGDIAATMTVTAPASYGSVAGRVRGLGQCEAHPAMIAGANVRIENASGAVFTTTSASDGNFRYWLDAAQGPFTVTVEAADHLTLSHSVALTAGNENVQNFDLRLLSPCLMPDPASLSAVLEPGQILDKGFDLLNGGPVAGAWSARVGGDPSVLTPLRMSQTSSPDPEPYMSFGCVNTGNGYIMENRWMRVFPLAEQGLSGSQVEVRGINFVADSASSRSGSQSVQVRVYALNGELTLANLSLLGETTVQVADTDLQRISAVFAQPFNVPIDTVLVAEVAVADGSALGTSFYAGGNMGGNTAPAYFVAPGCGVDEPISYTDFGFEAVHLILEVDVVASNPCGVAAAPVPWLGLTPNSGTVAGDSVAPLTARFNAVGSALGTHQASLCLAPSNGGNISIPVNMVVSDQADQIFANGFE